MKQGSAMGDQRNYAALDWVMGEIEETLNEARQALEAFVADPKDTTRLRFCITHIHQVRGSLQIVEFHGASLLAEEMEQLAQAMMDQKVSNYSDAQEVLMRSLLQLPIYLDHVKVYRDDSARTILPLLNDLRAVRNERFLSESNLFSPNLDSLAEISGARHAVLGDAEKLKQVTKKLREMYQFSAASVLRGIKVDENLEYLEKVFSRLEALATGTAIYPLWQASSALVHGLRRDEIDLSVAVRALMRHLARELRLLSEQAPSSFELAPKEGLFKNILYYIARADSQSEKLKAIKERFELRTAELNGSEENVDGYSVSALDPEAVRSVVFALREELKSITSRLDAALNDDISPAEIAEVLPVVKRVGDTLAVLGIAELRKSMIAQADTLEEMAKENSVDTQKLTRVAADIIDVDNKLEAIGKAVDRHRDLSTINERVVEIDEAKMAVIRECTVGLERAKDAIIEYMSSAWDTSHLDNIEQFLTDIRGGLDIIPLPRPAAVIDACSRFITQELCQQNNVPEWKTLESLADAMASVEYYLERLAGDMSEDADSLLEGAELSVEALGYPVRQHSAVSLAEDVEDAIEAVSHATEAEIVSEAPPAEPVHHAELQQPIVEAVVEPEPEEDESLSSELEPEFESDIDEEIIEVFIEEAAEVRDTLDEYLPKWAQDLSDEESLTVVRRSFHTLKGSGRMVEAMEIGELAWAIENMLNRVIDRTVEVVPEHAALAGAVVNILPAMVKAFELRRHNPEKALTEQYSVWAFAMADGQIPDDLLTKLAEPEPLVAEQELTEQEPAEQLVEPQAAELETVDEDESDDDDVLLEIFSSEAESHLSTIADFIEQMEEEAPLYSPPTDQLQRALHTLKGSARMAQVNPIAQMFEVLESFAKELVTFQVAINEDILQLMRDAESYTAQCLRAIAEKQQVEIPKLEQFLARTAELRELSVGPLVRMKEQERDGERPVDPQLLSIFMAEEMRLLLDADELLERWLADPLSAGSDIEALRSELSTLSTGAERANLPDMASFATELCEIHGILLSKLDRFDATLCLRLKQVHNALLDMVDAVAAGQNLVPPPEEMVAELAAIKLSLIEDLVPDNAEPELEPGELIEQEPALDEFDSIAPTIPEPQPEPEPDAGFVQEPELSEQAAVEFEAPDAELEEISPTDFAGSDSGEFVAEETAEALETFDAPADENDQLAFTQDIAEPVEHELNELPPQDESAADNEAAFASLPSEEPQAPETKTETAAPISGADLLDEIDSEAEDFDPDILDIFLEEAQELFEELDEAISEWEREPSSGEGLEVMKRVLHTMKGGARLAGLPNLGELVHNYESYLIGLKLDLVDSEVFESVHSYQDRIDRAVAAVRRVASGESLELAENVEDIIGPSYDENIIDEAEISTEDPVPTEADEQDTATDHQADEHDTATDHQAEESAEAPEPHRDSTHNVVPFIGRPKLAENETGTGPVVGGGGGSQNVAALKKSGPQEVVRVNSELLEELVNLAGETSISRSRLEEQVSEFGFSLDEIDSTIDRLQEQLRRLDIETEAQILFRQEQMAVHAEEFDPLEMDRYSSLQQLSRSLIESASDLADLRSELTDKVRDAETILLQQSRINTTLQEGLMRSRMVPFSRLVPRLRRIVRQVASELGKKVSLELDNVEGELDRNVLERMVPPFEHMLRNAVDHGIEQPEDRVSAGKSETGRIVLTLGREGGDVIIRLADDGRGIDLKAVRAKAIERGLMTEDADLSDYDIMQFILHAGFSTAENVTQISGRGVGMDVVHAEIKQLGGDVAINSQWGKGTQFVIRLPFTLSVNRALMVNIGHDNYAIPLNSIEGIVRISPFELEHYYEHPDAEFEYANEKYKVRYLGGMLYPGMRANMDGQVLPLPIILVRTAQHAMALQVDGLMGSREIVVKSLGPQFSAVQGLSGATVMGDGSVVVILDPHALVRQEIANSDLLLAAAEQAKLAHDSEDELPAIREEKVFTVMVVDDSVTVRKVTTRFLEREGYNVITAKDGVDALQVLQDETPDVMLLDIEMPRMDGFEVAKNIRTTQRWKQLPIIMITSRTGEKHREHALSLGVNRYMGKPYQEEALLEAIGALLDEQTH
jgi:chemosensory pili system protein ChpA (sensor histidine kinase/response regulator)